MLDRKVGDMLQLFTGIDPAGGIGRIDQNDHARSIGNLCRDVLARDGKLIGLVELGDHHRAASQFCLPDMLRIERVEQDHFIARVDRGHERCKGCVRQAIGHQHFIDPVVQGVEIAQLANQGFSKRKRPTKITIMDDASIERCLCGLLDVIGRVSVRTSEFEMNQIHAFCIELARCIVHPKTFLRSRRKASRRPFHRRTSNSLIHVHNCVIYDISSLKF